MNWFRRFMAGRYGTDQLNMALLILYAILIVANSFLGKTIIQLISLLVLAVYFFRALSRNTYRRYQENFRFNQAIQPALSWLRQKAQRIRSLRYYKYFKCPSCSQKVRVPRGKGRINVTCPKCRHTFLKKS